MVWYSYLFPQFVVIHTVKGFGVVNKAEDVFWNSLAFSMIQWMLAIWSLVLLPFLNPTCTSGSSWFTYFWMDFEHNLASLWNECNYVVIWTFFGIAFLWDWMKTDLFQSCGHCSVFQISCHIECGTLTLSKTHSCPKWLQMSVPPMVCEALYLPSPRIAFPLIKDIKLVTKLL